MDRLAADKRLQQPNATVVNRTMLLGWIKGRQFEKPQPPLRDYWVIVEVRLSEPLPVEGEDKLARGYVRILGLRCEPLRLRSFIEEHVRDGVVLWDETEWNEVDVNKLSRKLRRYITVDAGESSWHLSGHIYFSEFDEDAPAAD